MYITQNQYKIKKSKNKNGQWGRSLKHGNNEK